MPTAKGFKKELERTIGQIRFRPTLQWFAAKAIAGSVLEDSYQEWRTDENDNPTLYSSETNKALDISSDHLTYVSESSLDKEELISHLRTLLDNAVTNYAIKEIRRIGVRRTFIVQTSFKFNEIVELLSEKFYANIQKIEEISGPGMRDVAFVLDSVKDGFKNHIQLGPAAKEEGIRLFNSKFDRQRKALEKEGNLYIDIDVSLDKTLDGENAIDLLEDAIDQSQSIYEGYLNYIKSA